jgi:hypothetical protein
VAYNWENREENVDYIEYMLWKLLVFFILAVIYGFIRRSGEG